MTDPLTAVARPLLCAHRGLSQACPENTLPAFGAALALGADEIELDLWLSRDGVPVVCHDPTVDRTTTGSGRIHDLTWSEIRRLDAGARCSQAWSGTRVPCFDQVLEAVGGRLDLNIHIKEPGPDGVLVRLVCDRLRDLRLSSSAYIAGDCEATLQTALECAPEIARACLVAQEDPLAQVQAAREYRCRRVQFGRHVSVDAIRAAHDAGLVCNLFWSDEVEDTLAFARLGIDVILTNCLHRLVDDPRLRDNA